MSAITIFGINRGIIVIVLIKSTIIAKKRITYAVCGAGRIRYRQKEGALASPELSN